MLPTWGTAFVYGSAHSTKIFLPVNLTTFIEDCILCLKFNPGLAKRLEVSAGINSFYCNGYLPKCAMGTKSLLLASNETLKKLIV